MALPIFFRQLLALSRKDALLLKRHWFLNLLRAVVIPIIYAIFLAIAQNIFNKTNNFGLGTTTTVSSLSSQFDGKLKLVWVDATSGSSYLPASEIMAQVTSSFSTKQLSAVEQISSADDIPAHCPANFNLFSNCFASVVFNGLPQSADDTTSVNYTIRGDGGLLHIDVKKHNSDFEKRIFPLQWAIDSAILNITAGSVPPTPQEWAFTQQTNDEQNLQIRLSYIRGIRSILSLAFFIYFVPVVYHIAGAYMNERALGLASHMQAMGVLDSARVMAWYSSLTTLYGPPWLVAVIIWRAKIFKETSPFLLLIVHSMTGQSLASYAFFTAAPFGKSPQLAAVWSTMACIVIAILAQVIHLKTFQATMAILAFPPAFYIYAMRAITGFENHQLGASFLKGDPDHNLKLIFFVIAAFVNQFTWPIIAVYLERFLYDARNPEDTWFSWLGRRRSSDLPHHPSKAIVVKNLNKTYPSSGLFGSGETVTAVSDLSFSVPKTGIFVLLGSNGAGKSTTLSILAGLTGRTGGSVSFEGGSHRPARGTLGIVPQKNVLFPELTCAQHLRLWGKLKRSKSDKTDEDISQLLKDCDLSDKEHALASTLSGGQKRKLQLAIGLVGGSKIVLVDECTSGVDPLSRRALWRSLSSVRHDRAIVFTTHFLDEADLLADQIAILAAPGKLVAEGSPVSLKSNLGDGYSIHVKFAPEKVSQASSSSVLGVLQRICNTVTIGSVQPTLTVYRLNTRDAAVVLRSLQQLEVLRTQGDIVSFDVQGSSIEDVFLKLMAQEEAKTPLSLSGTISRSSRTSDEKPSGSRLLNLADGRPASVFSQAATIFYKRLLVARRSWLTPLLAVVIAICGACIPIFFLSKQPVTCNPTFDEMPTTPLFLPATSGLSSIGGSNFGSGSQTTLQLYQSPPGVIQSLGSATAGVNATDLPNQQTFIDTINMNFQNFTQGGISVDASSKSVLVAWEASPPGLTGSVMLNMASNVLFGLARNASGAASPNSRTIFASYQPLPGVPADTLLSLRWVIFFAGAMAVYPAFFALYVTKERTSKVQAMQFSNGLSKPIGLWLGHFAFDSIFVLVLSSIITIIFAALRSGQFHGLGFLWFIMVLYGLGATLFAYFISLFASSPLAAFALSAAYQVIYALVYLLLYLFTLTYSNPAKSSGQLNIIHFLFSLISPMGSLMRATFVSVNLFSLLCNGRAAVSTSAMGSLTRFGGCILYCVVQILVLLFILVVADSGSILSVFRRTKDPRSGSHYASEKGIANDALQVMNVNMSWKGGEKKAVDDVSFKVAPNEIFALVGPNGAGKTTTYNVITGDVRPDSGEVLIRGVSAIQHPTAARLALGVCPQFTAIDPQLTVSEHLHIYGKLKGLRHGHELDNSIVSLISVTGLTPFANRLASKLSGGNARKLALCISLIGNPSVILIDEFSTGIDAKMKRDMWDTLRSVAREKAVVITTHSMEEASALATNVGILARRMLAIGTPELLAARYDTYEVHFSCPTREEAKRARTLMARIPGAHLADDVSTRYEVPLRRGDSPQAKELDLAELFHFLTTQGDFSEYTVERLSLESVFLKVIRADNVKEDKGESKKKRWRMC